MEVELHDLLKDRLANFWGYGSLNAPVWFVGMEEGLSDPSEIPLRLKASFGKKMIDLRSPEMAKIRNHIKWFSPGADVQHSWIYPIAFSLFLQRPQLAGVELREAIRQHQINVLGDEASAQTAVLELMPLPCKRVDEETWPYTSSGLDTLASRATYLFHHQRQRVEALKRLLEENDNPKTVLFYSLKYLRDWISVIGKEGVEQVRPDMYLKIDGKNLYCIMPHSQMVGMSYARVRDFAVTVRSRTLQPAKQTRVLRQVDDNKEHQAIIDPIWTLATISQTENGYVFSQAGRTSAPHSSTQTLCRRVKKELGLIRSKMPLEKIYRWDAAVWRPALHAFQASLKGLPKS